MPDPDDFFTLEDTELFGLAALMLVVFFIFIGG
jgi:hypothetical protein